MTSRPSAIRPSRAWPWAGSCSARASLAAPAALARSLGVVPSPELTYLTRIFAGRAIALGAGYLTEPPGQRRRWQRLTLFVDVTDTLAALGHLRRRDLPRSAVLALGALTGGYAAVEAAPGRHRPVAVVPRRSAGDLTGRPAHLATPVPAEQSGGMDTVTRTRRSLAADIGVMRRESGMAMATIASLDDTEIRKPTRCAGWTRAHVLAHLAQDADALANLATWAVTGRETPAYASREQRDTDIEAAAGRSAAELVTALAQANGRLLGALQRLQDGVRVEALPTLFSGEISAYSLPARRTTELVVHHNDLDTTWEWHEAGPDAIVDAIDVCVHRLQAHPDAPGLHVVAREGEEWTVGDGAYRIEGYYEVLLPFLARAQVEDGLQHEGEVPALPPW